MILRRELADDPDAVAQRAWRYIDVEHDAEAETMLRRALTDHPDHIGLWLTLSYLLACQERDEEQLEATAAALDIAPEHPDPYFRRGRALWQLGRRDEALDVLAAGLEQDPHHYQLLLHYGEYLGVAGRHRESVEVLERALESHPRDADLLCRLAHTLHYTGRQHRAHELLTEALAIDPHNAITWYALAENHRALLLARASLAAYATSMRLEPRNASLVSKVRQHMTWPLDGIYDSLRWPLPVIAAGTLIATTLPTIPAWLGVAVTTSAAVASGYAAHWAIRGGLAAWRHVTWWLGTTYGTPAVGTVIGHAGLAATVAAAWTGDVATAVGGLVAGVLLWLVIGADCALMPDRHADKPFARRILAEIGETVRIDLTVRPRVMWARLTRALKPGAP